MMAYNDLREQDYSFPASDPLFFKLEIFKIQDIFKIKISKFIYKCLDKNIPINFHNWFTLTTQLHNYNTGLSLKKKTGVWKIALPNSLRRAIFCGKKSVHINTLMINELLK